MAELSTVTIASPGGETEATFVPGANLVGASLRHRGAELLDERHGVQAYAEQGSTMGIPLLYPWANRLSRAGYAAAGQTVTLPAGGRYPLDPGGLPIHGALPGDLRWDAERDGGDRLRARLAWDGDGLLALFPFRHEVEVLATAGERDLTIETTVRANGGDAVPVSFGYHPYLRLPGSDRHGWQVDLGAAQQLVLDDRMIPTGERTPIVERDFLLGDRDLDEGLADLATPAQFLVSDGELALSVSFEAGYEWAQLFAPPASDVICIEPMTAPTDALNSHTGLTVLEPGAEHVARFAIAVLP